MKIIRELGKKLSGSEIFELVSDKTNFEKLHDQIMNLSVPGIGPWTKKSALLVSSIDWDVFLEEDSFIRKRLQRWLGRKMSIRDARLESEKWFPYRGVVAWYLWRDF